MPRSAVRIAYGSSSSRIPFTNDTARHARLALRSDGEVIECDVRGAGPARNLGVAAALNHFRGIPSEQIWLANADADTHVPLDWLERQIEFENEGDTGVAGIVELDFEPRVAYSVRDISNTPIGNER